MIEEGDFSGFGGDSAEVGVEACHDGLPVSDPVEVEYSVDFGTFTGSSPIPNCEADEETNRAGFNAPPGEGSSELKAVFTFSDTSLCIAFETINYEEEENGNNDD